jgi:preprotein translocase subunit YajC
MLSTLLLFAQTTAEQATNQGGDPNASSAPPWAQYLPIMALGVVFMLWLFLMPRRQEAERKKMMASLKKGDEVLVHPGIYGTIASVSETEDQVEIEVDKGTRLKMLKSCIARNLSNEKAAKDEKDKK